MSKTSEFKSLNQTRFLHVTIYVISVRKDAFPVESQQRCGPWILCLKWKLEIVKVVCFLLRKDYIYFLYWVQILSLFFFFHMSWEKGDSVWLT